MAHSWSSVENIDHAAAFRALGIAVMSDKSADVNRGKSWVKWSVSNDGKLPGTDSAAGPLVRAVNRGEIDGIDPAHPILDSLGVLKIRHQLVDAVKNGTRYRIDIDASFYGAVLWRGDEPAFVRNPPHFRTGDLKLASALIRLGMPLASITGTSPGCVFHLACPGYALHGSEPVPASVPLAFRDLHRDTWAHPAPTMDPAREPVLNRLCALMNALWIRDRLHDYANGRTQNLIIESPFSKRSVLMPEDSPGHIIDRNRKFLGIP